MVFRFLQSFGVANPKETTACAIFLRKERKEGRKERIVSCHPSAQISGGMFTMLRWVSDIYGMQRGSLDTRESKPCLNSVLQIYVF